MVAPAGAGPWPQITSVRPRFTSCTITGTSPPGPLRCGSTTCSVNAVAAPASKALPPFSRVAIPTAVAIQCVEVTTPKVPSISGRVVKGLGLMLPAIWCLRWVPAGAWRDCGLHLTTAATTDQRLFGHQAMGIRRPPLNALRNRDIEAMTETHRTDGRL